VGSFAATEYQKLADGKKKPTWPERAKVARKKQYIQRTTSRFSSERGHLKEQTKYLLRSRPTSRKKKLTPPRARQKRANRNPKDRPKRSPTKKNRGGSWGAGEERHERERGKEKRGYADKKRDRAIACRRKRTRSSGKKAGGSDEISGRRGEERVLIEGLRHLEGACA